MCAWISKFTVTDVIILNKKKKKRKPREKMWNPSNPAITGACSFTSDNVVHFKSG